MPKNESRFDLIEISLNKKLMLKMQGKIMGKRILIIDDNENHLDVLKETLCYFNFEVKTLASGNYLMEEVYQFKPDLILLDYILPGKDNGIVLCQQLKNNIHTHNIPVVLMSGYHLVSEQFSCCDGFLYKPFDLNILIKELATYLDTTIQIPFSYV